MLLAAIIYFMPSGNPAREAIATVLALPLAGVLAVLIGGDRAKKRIRPVGSPTLASVIRRFKDRICTDWRALRNQHFNVPTATPQSAPR